MITLEIASVFQRLYSKQEGVSMTQYDKAGFRRTPEWHEWKAVCRENCGGVDFVTDESLKRGWELHHLDLNNSAYSKLGNVENFLPLNKETHKCIHFLYPFYKKWKGTGEWKNMMDRLELVLRLMYSKEEV